MESPGPGEASHLRAQPAPPLYGTAASQAWPEPQGPSGAPSIPRCRAYGAVAILCYINLLNYMNWFIIPGVLLDIQKHFRLSDSEAGLLQTVFISGLLLAAPLFGYLGDRYSRKVTLSVGIVLWSSGSLSGSFLPGRYSWLFFLSRGVVGIGVASYSTIAPTIIGDLFVKDQRTWMLSVFYIFIPVGSGLGYVLGSAVTKATGDWHWAFRIMPCLEAVALALLVLLVPDPPRGGAEEQSEAGGPRTSWCEDVSYLGKNLSFVWSTLGVTAMAFVTGALGFWAPKFLYQTRVLHGLQPPCPQEPSDSSDRFSWHSESSFSLSTGPLLLTSCCLWLCPAGEGLQKHCRSPWATSWEMLAAPTSLDLRWRGCCFEESSGRSEAFEMCPQVASEARSSCLWSAGAGSSLHEVNSS
uniref:Protein spinster homolog 3 isoform X3 n=1 Tax=Phascolarctos cinereus TaxID=38626 RepID=A0A6P5IEN3_PHACI|nr:protein spinster homolog 3 isoform X3 [Phascolarctos cinereus]